MKKGIFFDLDGTLWDAVESITNSWNEELRRLGYDIVLTTPQLQKEMGKLMEAIADNILPMIEVPKRYEVLQKCTDYEMIYLAKKGGDLYEGLESVLEKLSKDYFLAVISNGQESYVKGFLDFYGFHKYFKDYEEAGRTGLPKNENIKLVAERNGIEQFYYVGDIEADMIAAEEAGATFIYAAYGFGKISTNPLKVDDIRHLPDLMKKLETEE